MAADRDEMLTDMHSDAYNTIANSEEPDCAYLILVFHTDQTVSTVGTVQPDKIAMLLEEAAAGIRKSDGGV